MCLSAGMDSYITKPFQPAQLTEMFRTLPVADRAFSPIKKERAAAGDVSTPVQDTLAKVSVAEVMAYLQGTTHLTVGQNERIMIAVQKSISDNLAKATAALADKDYPALGLAAHALKGTLLQCGLQELAAMAEEIHQGTKSNNNQAQRYLLKNLKIQLVGLIGTTGTDNVLE